MKAAIRIITDTNELHKIEVPNITEAEMSFLIYLLNAIAEMPMRAPILADGLARAQLINDIDRARSEGFNVNWNGED